MKQNKKSFKTKANRERGQRKRNKRREKREEARAYRQKQPRSRPMYAARGGTSFPLGIDPSLLRLLGRQR